MQALLDNVSQSSSDVLHRLAAGLHGPSHPAADARLDSSLKAVCNGDGAQVGFVPRDT